jgi:hypothetical protein
MNGELTRLWKALGMGVQNSYVETLDVTCIILHICSIFSAGVEFWLFSKDGGYVQF